MQSHQTLAPSALPLHPQDEAECRRCGIHCDKVVYPAACLDRGCPFVYAYEEFGHTYIGCMQRVYDVEIDLEMLHEAEARREGFGAIRTTRAPLPMCRVEVEECYGSERTGELLMSMARKHTLLVIDHDMTFVRQIARTVTVLHEGKTLCQGTVQEVQRDPKVIQVYLGQDRQADAAGKATASSLR